MMKQTFSGDISSTEPSIRLLIFQAQHIATSKIVHRRSIPRIELCQAERVEFRAVESVSVSEGLQRHAGKKPGKNHPADAIVGLEQGKALVTVVHV